MKVIFLILLTSFVGHCLAQTSYVPFTQTLKEKGYQFSLGADYFSTIKVVDDKGTSTDLVDGETFKRLQADFSGQYGLSDELQLGFGARFRQNQSTFFDENEEEFNASSTGFQSTYATVHYAFKPVGQMHYTLEGLYRYTPYSNTEATAEDLEKLILGDDGNEYSFGLGVTYAFKSNDFLSVRGGYRRPGKDLSDEIYWQAEGALVWKYFALVAGADGVSSLNRDPYEDDPDQKPIYNTGASNIYNGMNREWIAPYVGLNIAMGDHWRTEFRASQVVSGKSTDLGTAFGIQLIRRVENKSSKKNPDLKFKSYDLEVSITKVSPQKKYVVVDKGLADDVQKGMSFDFFEFDYVGGNIMVARGTVIQVKADSAIVKITNRFNPKKDIKEGLIGRAVLR